ncbi:hypothetical protein DXG01_006797 [Tephrocybe rancida]|nr:hypothetical protein DXG01_006797 [Tephrocybe rancida]
MAAPTDTYELLKYNMVHAHDTFKLGYDTILSHLESPPHDDLKNFLGYCEAWALSIESHHTSEEEVVFPFLNQKMDFSGEKAQHEIIHANLDRLLALIIDAKADPSKFDAAALKDLMAEFREPLYTHLDEEVEHISASNLKEAQFEEHDVKTMVEKLEAYAKSHGDPFLLVPFMRRSVLAISELNGVPMFLPTVTLLQQSKTPGPQCLGFFASLSFRLSLRRSTLGTLMSYLDAGTPI